MHCVSYNSTPCVQTSCRFNLELTIEIGNGCHSIVSVEAKWFFKHSSDVFCPFSWVTCLSLPDVPDAPLALSGIKAWIFLQTKHRTVILCANSCLLCLRQKSWSWALYPWRISSLIWRYLDGLCCIGLWFALWSIFRCLCLFINKIPQTEWFEQQKCVFLQFWRPEV